MMQGAFSLSFLSWGRSLKDRTSGTKLARLQHFKVSCGRITAFHNAPMQIKWDDVHPFCEPTLEHSSLAKWLKAEFHGSCLKKVLAINEERTVEWYLQFQVPQKLECTFPKQVSFGKKKLLMIMLFLLLPLDQTSLALQLKKVCMNIGKILQVLPLLRKRIGPIVLLILKVAFLLFRESICYRKSV